MPPIFVLDNIVLLLGLTVSSVSILTKCTKSEELTRKSFSEIKYMLKHIFKEVDQGLNIEYFGKVKIDLMRVLDKREDFCHQIS